MSKILTGEQLEKRKKLNKKILTVFGSMFLLLILFVAIIPKGSNSDSVQAQDQKESINPKTKEEWEKLTYDQKEEWLNSTLANKDKSLNELELTMKKMIKEKFNYPEEVDFAIGELPRAKDGEIIDVRDGLVFFSGQVTAKNAFGVKSKYAYSIRTYITPGNVNIDEVTISER